MNGPTSITVNNFPAHAAGTVDITVQPAGGTSATSAADHYTFVAGPDRHGREPASGPTAGGNTVDVTGTLFSGATDVFVGAVDITSVCPGRRASLLHDQQRDRRSRSPAFPSHGAGTVDITVQTVGGTSATSSNDHYTFVVAPTVTQRRARRPGRRWAATLST